MSKGKPSLFPDFATRVLEDEGLTFVEKAMFLHGTDQKVVRAKDITILKIDFSFAQDSSGPLAIRSLKEIGIQKVWDPIRILLVIDHTYPASDVRVADLRTMIKEFVEEPGCLVEKGNHLPSISA
jgi:3-isopropylmalate/(R)-2-methylmalate dehydratase large subunit